MLLPGAFRDSKRNGATRGGTTNDCRHFDRSPSAAPGAGRHLLTQEPGPEMSDVFAECEVCGGVAFRDVLAYPGAGIYVQCEHCELVRAPRVAPFDYQAEGYVETLTRQALAGTVIWNQTLDEIERIVPRGRIVEVGCSVGTQLGVAQRRGWKALGFDLNRDCTPMAALLHGVDVRSEDFVEHVFDEPVDVVLMHQDIEHVPTPRPFLDAVDLALRPGGAVVFTTPNWAFVRPLAWANRRLGMPIPTLDHLQPAQHIRLYSPTTFKVLAGQRGWTLRTVKDNPTDSLGNRSFFAPRSVVGRVGRVVASATGGRIQLALNMLVILQKPAIR